MKQHYPIVSRLILTVSLFLPAFFLHSQTTLIAPAGNGGFESGTTFAANGWTTNNPATTNTNQWVCSTGATVGFAGTQSAYITNNTAGIPPHAYTIGTAYASHFYRNITVPAGENQISLSFSYIGQGESTFDYIRVWLVSTTFNPVYGVPITATGVAPTGRVQAGGYFNLQPAWTTANVAIPASYAGATFRIVFEWVNDASLGTQPPGGIDNISLISQVATVPANDECAGAIPLTVSTTCSYAAYTNFNATASAGVPAPGCASYFDDDVWFSAIVPANGILTVDLQAGGITDSGMAFYTGTCGSLALLECDDDDSANGLMSSITRTGLTPGSTIYIRVWEYGGDVNGTFGICATTPAACAQSPSALTTTSATLTSATISWTAASPAPAGGYEYIVSASATPPTAGSAPSGSVGAGITNANITGLTANTTYYFWVRSVCAGSERSAWIAGSFVTGHCLSTGTGPTYYINNFTTSGGLSNIANNNSGYSPMGYGNFTAQVVSQNPAGNISFSSIYYDGVQTYGFNIWVDWNNDFDFADAGEKVYASGGYFASNTGTFTVPGATPAGNYRMRIRADYWSTDPAPCGTITSGETEDYTLNVVTLPCAGNPSTLIANITSPTTATISWTAAIPAPANGYQYFLSNSPTTPTSASAPSGSTASGILTANLTGLTPGTTYYLWVRSNCGGALGQGTWIGPVSFTIPTCGIGNSTGTTSLGCPSVTSGGLSLNGGDPLPIDCSTAGCVDLEATYLQLGRTTSYTVESIPFLPPYQFGCLKNPVSVNDDDVWSPVVNLPFNFCFYGNTYNQCLISSNGVISFDLSNPPGGYSGWSFANNLPSTTLFLNSIFGVYHDIDPSIGGEVGWELITLNTGCRALVASWSDIPMFSATCNAQLYTGMIVLYENTNIIDVYVQEKNVCATWNAGNAVIGIQNAAGNTATVAPNRNSLDADWTVIEEAWRFVPSGMPITSIRWFEGSGTLGPVIGTTDVLNVCPTATTTYTAEVTYTLCNGTTLIETDETIVTVNMNKVWNGSISTNWATAANWTPSGVPTALDCVLVPNTANDCMIYGGANGFAYSVTVQNGGVVDIGAGRNLTVTNLVNVAAGGTFAIHDSGSLIQIDNVANSGNITMERITKPMYRYDYTYWNSPVTAASGFTLGNLSPATQPDKYYSWQPSVAGASGNWIQESAASLMNPLKGYIIRAPQTYSTNPAVTSAYAGTFVGTPNNGIISAPVSYGTLGAGQTDDKWNLLGNPYPSAISAASFLNHPGNATILDGTVYFWTHNSPPSTAFPDPFYADFVINYTAADYASWNKLGGVGTIASSGGPLPNGYIAAGQSFFVKSLAVPGNAQFTNAMRVANFNNQFFKMSGPSNAPVALVDEELIERHRIWLNMTNESGAFNQILVGYAEGATLNWDRGLDGLRFNASNISFYSIIPDHKLVIQGRPIPFQTSDVVPLGYTATIADTFTIRLDQVDGLFTDQKIYLEDKWLNVIHNLKDSPYPFTTQAGIFDNRFQLRYASTHLKPVMPAAVSVALNQKRLSINATEQMTVIAVFDLSGKRICEFDAEGVKLFEGDFDYPNGVYLAKIYLKDGSVAWRKVVH